MREDLLAAAVGGDREAFTELMTDELPTLRGYIRLKLRSAADAEDTLQETMLAAWLRLNDYSGASFRGWLIGIARHKIADHYRSAYGAKTVTLDEAFANGVDEPSERNDDAADRETDVSSAMNALNDAERELVFMIFNAGMTYAEISELTGIPAGTVKSRMSSVKAKLRPILESYR